MIIMHRADAAMDADYSDKNDDDEEEIELSPFMERLYEEIFTDFTRFL
ncbi:MAG: hypothetical protein HY591_02940 [Candidatus Omnitrophica bacterium]|nr:hypothetical protein [Candidatus Omnitrophota bacterium]